jgi:hypothetical protein
MSGVTVMQGDDQNAEHQVMILAFNGLLHVAVIKIPVPCTSHWACNSVCKGFK